MTKFNTLLTILIVCQLSIKAQSVIFMENFGTTQSTRNGCESVPVPGTAVVGKYDPTKNELYTDHVWSTDSHIWLTDIQYTQTSSISKNPGACDDSGTTLNIRTNNPSTNTGSSGLGNLYFNGDITNSFTINNIKTNNFTDVVLFFNIFGKNKGDVRFVKIECNTGSGYSAVGTATIGNLSTTKQTWLAVGGISVPSSSNLSLRFSTPDINRSLTTPAPIEIRLDDIKIQGNPTAGLNTKRFENSKIIKDGTNLRFEGFEDSSPIDIYNVQGKQILSCKFIKSLDIHNIQKGLYIIKVGDYRQKLAL